MAEKAKSNDQQPGAPPPPYSPTPEKTPLLSQELNQPTTIIIQRGPRKVSCCGVACGFTCALIIFGCTCCIAIGAVLGAVFGSWATQCFGASPQAYITHSVDWRGTGVHSLELYCHGDVEFNATLTSTAVSSNSTLYGKSKEAAEATAIDFLGSADYFSLKFPTTFWTCSEQDVSLVIPDAATYLLEMDIRTTTGNIIGGAFSNQQFLKIDVETSSGDISLDRLVSIDSYNVWTGSGNLIVSNANSPSLDISTLSGDITFNNLNGSEISLKSSSGLIIGTTITLSTNDAEFDATSSFGSITINDMVFPEFGICDIELESSSGNVFLSVSGFSGIFDLSTSSGTVSVNGATCGRKCTGMIDGNADHSITIKTSSGNIQLNTL